MKSSLLLNLRPTISNQWTSNSRVRLSSLSSPLFSLLISFFSSFHSYRYNQRSISSTTVSFRPLFSPFPFSYIHPFPSSSSPRPFQSRSSCTLAWPLSVFLSSRPDLFSLPFLYFSIASEKRANVGSPGTILSLLSFHALPTSFIPDEKRRKKTPKVAPKIRARSPPVTRKGRGPGRVIGDKETADLV